MSPPQGYPPNSGYPQPSPQQQPYPQQQQGYPQQQAYPQQQPYPQQQQPYPQQPYPQQQQPYPQQQGYAPQQAYPQQPQGYAQQQQPYPQQSQPYPQQQQQAYPPPQQAQMGAYAAPPGQVMARAVWGVPLEPGERVLYYKRNARMGARIVLFILGIPMTMMFGLGLYLIYLAITDRSQSTYAQAITNRRLLSIDGRGHVLFTIRWEDIAGLNKVTRNGSPSQFGVRNRSGQQFMFTDDLYMVERVLTQWVDTPRMREESPEVPFDAAVL